MGVAEWDALAWWEQRLLSEGLAEEFSSDGAQQGSGPPEEKYMPLSGNTPGEFAAVGITETTL